MSADYWFRSRVVLPRLFGGETVVESDVKLAPSLMPLDLESGGGAGVIW